MSCLVSPANTSVWAVIPDRESNHDCSATTDDHHEDAQQLKRDIIIHPLTCCPLVGFWLVFSYVEVTAANLACLIEANKPTPDWKVKGHKGREQQN